MLSHQLLFCLQIFRMLSVFVSKQDQNHENEFNHFCSAIPVRTPFFVYMDLVIVSRASLYFGYLKYLLYSINYIV